MSLSAPGLARAADPVQLRRLALAEALLQQSLSPKPVQSVPEGLANMATAGVHGFFAGQEEGRIENRRRAASQTMADALMAGQTGVKEWVNPDTGQVAIPGRKPGMDAMLSVLAQNPDTAPQAMQALASQLAAKSQAEAQLRSTLAGKGLVLGEEGRVSPLPGFGESTGQLKAAELDAETPALLARKRGEAAIDVEAAGPKAAAAARATAPIDIEKQRQIDANKAEIEAPKRAVEIEKNLRGDFNNLPEVKNFREARVAYKSIVDAQGRDTLASDLNIVYGFAKLMDPGSVVREGEQVMVTKTGGIWDQIQGWINAISGGARLPPSVRDALVAEAQGRFAQHEEAFTSKAREMSAVAGRYGVDPRNILLDAIGEGKAQASPAPVQPGQKVSGADVAKLPEGTVVTGSDGRDYVIRNGQPVPVR